MLFNSFFVIFAIFCSTIHAYVCTRELTLTWKIGAPDGVERYMIFVNDQFPGPTLSFDQDDNIEIIVNNDLPFETTIHFHGIFQLGTPWSDGVPGLSQRPIPAGGRFTYKWKAIDYGTYWYHAHYQGQVMDGLFGAIQIKASPNIPTPFSSISDKISDAFSLQKASDNPTVITISDWNHFTSTEIRNISTSANIDPQCMDSILINGKGSVNCQTIEFLAPLVSPVIAPLLRNLSVTPKGCLPLRSTLVQTNTPHVFDLVPESLFDKCTPTSAPGEVIVADPKMKWISLNFVSASSVDELTVSIDGHSMWVYAVDGLFIEPQLVEAMTFPHGTRYAVAIKLDQTPADYTIRVSCTGLNQKISGYATLSYQGGSETSPQVQPFIDYGGKNTTPSVHFFDAGIAAPFNPDRPAQEADVTFYMTLERIAGAYQWAMNGTAFDPILDDATPLLYDPASAVPQVTITTQNGTWVDLVLEIVGFQPSHPIHKHSNKGYVIGVGTGPWQWETVAQAMIDIPNKFNLYNPPVVDSVYTPPSFNTGSWVVFRYHVVNPGPFLLHCHINPHLEGGMAMAMLDGLDEWPFLVPTEYQDPEEVNKTPTKYESWREKIRRIFGS